MLFFALVFILAFSVTVFSSKANAAAAPTARMVVEENSSVDIISFSQTNAKVKLEVNGTVSKVAVDKKADLNLKVDGAVKEVAVAALANLEITGKTKSIPVTVEKEAKGADIVSAVPVKAVVNADTSIKLTAGAEGSTIDKGSEECPNIIASCQLGM